ncbi:MAG TPA: ATP synthase F0 subunit B [Pyrinomonadaceae bacterium]|jgi:F0F1-type ATP synthase membrane subunit b/b'
MVLLAFAESGAVQLVPDGTLFIHIALILVMIWVLQRTFFKPINRIIESREKNKVGGSESENLLREVAEKEARYNEAMREARAKGYELIESERSMALAAKQETLSTTKEEVQQTLTSEMAELEKQTVEARAAIAAEAERMAEKISSNILRA